MITMRILLFAFPLIAIIGLSTELQAQNSPPPPLIWTPPDSSEVTKYVSSTHGFSIDFIGTPAVAENRGVLSFYTVRRKGSLMSVRVVHFTKEDLEKMTNLEIIQEIKAVYGTSHGFEILKLTKEQDQAIEFSSSNKYTFRRVKAEIRGDKLYELYIDVTNWHILQDYYKDRVDAFNREADRFFDSFRFLPKK